MPAQRSGWEGHRVRRHDAIIVKAIETSRTILPCGPAVLRSCGRGQRSRWAMVSSSPSLTQTPRDPAKIVVRGQVLLSDNVPRVEKIVGFPDLDTGR